jgi:hypothetical protein
LFGRVDALKSEVHEVYALRYEADRLQEEQSDPTVLKWQ